MLRSPGPGRTARPRVLLLITAAAAVLLAAQPATGVAKVLHDKKTGFALSAPKGSKLKRHGSAYIVTTKRLRVTVRRLRGAGSPRGAGAELARALGSDASQVKRSKRSWRALLVPRGGGASSAAAIRRRGKTLVVGLARDRAAASLSGSSPSSSPAALHARAALTAGELRAIQQLVDSVSGGRAARLGADVPLKQYVAPDGGASAFVPDRPGWGFSGGNGIVEGANANEGAFAFGVSFPVQLPSVFGQGGLIVSPFVTPAVALQTVVPEFIRRAGAQIAVTRATAFAGSEQILGAGIPSGFFAVEADVGGVPFDGVWLVGTIPSQDGSFWYLYYSYAIVRRGAPPGIGPALLKTWASWNPSVDRQRRVNQTLATILSTNVGGGPIDQDVFDEAAAKWGEYIRE